MATKRPKLFATTPSPAVQSPPQPAKTGNRAGQKMIGFYVDPPAYTQLRQLALDEGSSNQALLIEALNQLFITRGKLPIA